MKLILKRKYFTSTSTIGSLYTEDNIFLCYTLEDKDRGLDSLMDVEGIKKIKVFGKTAIPYGSYKVVMSFSNRFKMFLPQLLNVKGYEGVRIHAGNTAEDTEGCLLVGNTRKADFIGNSRKTLNDTVLPIINATVQTEKLFIEITRE